MPLTPSSPYPPIPPATPLPGLSKKKSMTLPLQGECDAAIPELAFLTQLLQSASTEDVGARGWYYVDEGGDVQGPFTSEEMNGWHVAGYLDGGIQISFGSGENWTLLGTLFPESATAFRGSLRETVGMLIERLEQIEKTKE